MFITSRRPPRHLSGAGTSQWLIEAGMNRSASYQSSGTSDAMAMLFTSKTANGVKTLNGVSVYYISAASSPVVSAWLYPTSAGEPTGDWAAKGGALAATAAGTTITAGGFFLHTFSAGYAILPDVQYAIMLSHPTGGATFSAGYNPLISVDGWGCRFTESPATNIQDSLWNYDYPQCPILQLNFSDGSRETCHVAASSGGAGTPDLYGTDRMAGISITPDFDMPLARIIANPEYSGTAASAGSLLMRVYDDTKTRILAESSAIAATEFDAASRRHRYFDFSAVQILRRGRQYNIVGVQSAGGGSASHFMRMGASVGGSYVTNAYPPQSAGQNQYHGIFSISSTTGSAALAYNNSVCPYIGLVLQPSRR